MRARARREDGSVRRFFCIVVVVVVVVVEKVRASPRKDSIRFDSIRSCIVFVIAFDSSRAPTDAAVVAVMMVAANDLRAGTRLGANGRYVVGEMINRGGTAVVYRGEDSESGEAVALKCVDVSENASMRVPLRAVKREIKYSTRLMDSTRGADTRSRTRVVRLLNVVRRDETLLVLVFELCDGSDVLDHINARGGSLCESEAKTLFAQLVEAIKTIHDHGFCHRDVKPENAVVGKEGLKLIDFGLAKGLESANTRAIGTPDYMAPELLDKTDADGKPKREKYDATACDVWSAGVFLYIMLTGRYPFQSRERPKNVKATLQNILSANYPKLPRSASREVHDLMERMLEIDPKKRIRLREVSKHPWLKSPSSASSSASSSSKKPRLMDRLKKSFRRLTLT